MAREIQEIFLPQQYPTFPHGTSTQKSLLRFHHLYRPAAAVSGDFFNVIPLSDSEAGMFVCDVMGHGLRAALVTAIMRGLVEKLMPLAGHAGRFLTDLNQSLLTILQRTDEPLLCTAVYLIADASRKELRFASAGHPSPLLLRRDENAVQSLRDYDPRHGPALGLFDNSVYPTCRCAFQRNDAVLLFTDGLYEVEGPKQEEYGQERLLAAVRRRIHLPMKQLFDEILAEVLEFSARKELEDDVCLVSVEQ